MKTHTATMIVELTCYGVSCLTLIAGGRLLYAGTTDNKTRVMCGDEEGPVFDGFPVSIMAPRIAIVGGKPLYPATRNGKEIVIHGSHESRPCDRVAGLSFTPDGSVAYQAEDASDHYVVVNGVEGKHYPSVWMHGFEDGKALYAVDLQRRDRTKNWKEERARSRERMVFGTDEGPICRAVLKDGCRPIIAQGRAIYGVLNVDGTCSVIDGEKIGSRYHSVSSILSQLVDGNPVYIAIKRDERGSVLIHGEKEVVRHRYIDHLSWVDGEPLYVAYEGGVSFLMHGTRRFDYDYHINPPDIVEGKPFFIGQTGGYVGDERPFGQFVVYDDTRGEPYEGISWLEMLGGQPAYVANLPSDSYDEDCEEIPRACFVHGTKRGQVYARIDAVTAAGDVPVYRGMNNEGESCVVVGTDEGHFFDQVFSIAYDADRREVSYGALKNRTVSRVTVKV